MAPARLVPGDVVNTSFVAAPAMTVNGALLAGAFVLAAMLLLTHMPYFSLLVALVFLAMFLAAYWTKTSKNNSYVFLQMGMVVPLVLIGENGELGSVVKAIDRMIGVAVGLMVASFVNLTWPHENITATAAPKPVLTEQ